MKIIGAAFVSLLPLIIAFDLINKMRKKVEALNEFERLIDFVKDEIRFNSREKSDIFSIVSDNGFSNPLIIKLAELKSGSFDLLYENYKQYGFEKEDFNILASFYDRLGFNDEKGQINHCNYYETIVKKRLDIANNELKQKSRLYIGLFFALSAFIFIILC